MIVFKLRPTVVLLMGVCLIMPFGLQAQATTPAAAGTVQGTVLFGGSDDPILVSGARIVAYGETKVSSTVSDREGKFSLSKLEPGIYLVEATGLRLRAEGNARVDAGAVTQIALQLEPQSTKKAKR